MLLYLYCTRRLEVLQFIIAYFLICGRRAVSWLRCVVGCGLWIVGCGWLWLCVVVVVVVVVAGCGCGDKRQVGV